MLFFLIFFMLFFLIFFILLNSTHSRYNRERITARDALKHPFVLNNILSMRRVRETDLGY
jgi:predicted permease